MRGLTAGAKPESEHHDHNHGEPIPEELLPRIFDPFKRHPEDQRPHEGKGGARSLGLGLHIVQQIAGHSTIGVTMTIYAHASLNEKRDAMKRLGERLG